MFGYSLAGVSANSVQKGAGIGDLGLEIGDWRWEMGDLRLKD